MTYLLTIRSDNLKARDASGSKNVKTQEKKSCGVDNLKARDASASKRVKNAAKEKLWS